LVDRADFVLCPIDCVSHQACLKVKVLCRRRAKPFVPLRSSSASSFARAIKALQAALPVAGRPFARARPGLSAPPRADEQAAKDTDFSSARGCGPRATHTFRLRLPQSGT
jgi:hypothetical protein